MPGSRVPGGHRRGIMSNWIWKDEPETIQPTNEQLWAQDNDSNIQDNLQSGQTIWNRQQSTAFFPNVNCKIPSSSGLVSFASN